MNRNTVSSVARMAKDEQEGERGDDGKKEMKDGGIEVKEAVDEGASESVDFSEACILGIDEAGRGPVLGPMVYAAAVIPISRKEDLKKLGADDSKALKKGERSRLRKVILGAPFVRTFECVITAESLSNNMLARRRYNLNLISHDAALSLVQQALDAGLNVTEVYADTVGPPHSYADKFRRAYPGLSKVDVRKKADSIFPIVGAASIMAKTTRDSALHEWEVTENGLLSTDRGSGYPGDETTKKWLRSALDPVFGFPNLVRFSWGTTRTLLENATLVEW